MTSHGRTLKKALMLAAALALAACSPAPEAPAVPALPSPEAFVRSLYGEGEFPGGAGPFEERSIWSARTRALLAETIRLTQEGDIGFFEADPICDCQDGTPVLQTATATSTGPQSADVAVVQGFAEPSAEVHHKTYNLVFEDGRWRIDDQHYGSMGEFPYEPMVQRLEAWIAGAKAQPAT